jgi:Ni,Fe-hydrogenase I cytochrome b subunit
MMLLYLPFIIQGIVMMVDEYFHLQRDLPRWERLGHPLDTLTVLSCYLFLILAPYSGMNLYIFIGLGVFSSLFITKDEFIHAQNCSPTEHWLHSLLFLLHPLTFLCGGILWKESAGIGFLQIQTVLVFIFMIYQILRWSIPWRMEVK